MDKKLKKEIKATKKDIKYYDNQIKKYTALKNKEVAWLEELEKYSKEQED